MTQSAPRFPDGAASRAVLIGCSDFADIDLPAIPGVKSNLTDLRSALTDQTHGILRPEHCRVLADPADHRSVGMALAQAAREAEDLLLVYYTGHGLLDEDGLLHLALSSTDPGHVGFTGVPADLVKRYLGRARARLRVLVLDCCFSGRAVAVMTESGSLLSAQLDVSGTYTLTSTTATAPSHAPPGQRHTAFTAALLDSLSQPEPLTLDGIHQHIDTVLKAAGLPRPQKRSVNTAGDIALVRGPVQPSGTSAKAAGDGADEVRFRRKPSTATPADNHRDVIAAVVFFVGTVTLTLVFGGWRVLLIMTAVVLGILGLIVPLAVVAERVRYELTINAQGLSESPPRKAFGPRGLGRCRVRRRTADNRQPLQRARRTVASRHTPSARIRPGSQSPRSGPALCRRGDTGHLWSRPRAPALGHRALRRRHLPHRPTTTGDGPPAALKEPTGNGARTAVRHGTTSPRCSPATRSRPASRTASSR
ncbi:caspase family protein [Streptomyces sp. NPDC051172]|uniref:caspase family protein n=1 Tax=Streptomyces sp. NPDC051172 TaxID=3155796 RepID=UPI0034382491